MAMRRVLAEADVGDQRERRLRLLQRADGELHDALGVIGARGGLVLVGGDPEQQHRRDAELRDRGRLLGEVRDRQALDAGHRLDRLPPVGSVRDEQRVDEMVGRQVGLAH